MATVARFPCDEAAILAASDRPCGTKRHSVLAATILASSMVFIDGTVVNVALPALQFALHATLADVQWVVESYALFLAALLLTGGSLGDLYGRRKIFLIGVSLFAVASAWCGLVHNIWQLIVARGLQGVGGALLVPGSLALISVSFPREERGRPFREEFKPSKKRPRIIDNPGGELKSLQTKINGQLLKSVTFPHYLCGGVPGKSVLDNVLLHLDAPVLVTVDIKSFFRKITNRQVYRVWRGILNCSSKIAALLTQLTTFERHLPQGAPTSSLLANLVLFSIDGPIREECARRGVTYSTWVDDLAFSGEEARAVIFAVVASLRHAGFSISHKKLHVMAQELVKF